mgnify:CR=1 FL=1
MTLHIQNPQLLPKVRSASLLAACSPTFMPCTLRIASMVPGWKCSSDDTVVPCHIDRTLGKGMGTKVSDLFVACGCNHCHAIIDGRDQISVKWLQQNAPTAFMERCLRGMAETQARWVELGLLTGKDWEIVK